MEIWVIILMISGSGRAMDIPPIYYETREECIEAGRELDGWPEFRCLRGNKLSN